MLAGSSSVEWKGRAAASTLASEGESVVFVRLAAGAAESGDAARACTGAVIGSNASETRNVAERKGAFQDLALKVFGAGRLRRCPCVLDYVTWQYICLLQVSLGAFVTLYEADSLLQMTTNPALDTLSAFDSLLLPQWPATEDQYSRDIMVHAEGNLTALHGFETLADAASLSQAPLPMLRFRIGFTTPSIHHYGPRTWKILGA